MKGGIVIVRKMYSREVFFLKITRDLCTGIVFENMWTRVLEWYAKLPLCTGMVLETAFMYWNGTRKMACTGMVREKCGPIVVYINYFDKVS